MKPILIIHCPLEGLRSFQKKAETMHRIKKYVDSHSIMDDYHCLTLPAHKNDVFKFEFFNTTDYESSEFLDLKERLENEYFDSFRREEESISGEETAT